MKSNKIKEAETRRVANYMRWLLELPDLTVSRRDSSLVGDLASLYMRCGLIRDRIDELLAISPTPQELSGLSKAIGAVWASVDTLSGYHRDLEPPLDRLLAKLLRLASREERGKKRTRSPAARR